MTKSIDDVIAELQATVARGEADISRYQKFIEDAREKVSDARTTLRTLRAMGVASGDDKPEAVQVQAPSNMTVPDMILWVLRRNPGKGYEPAQMISDIKNYIGLDPDPNSVRPTMWRMKNDGRLVQSADGRYSLPPKEKPADDKTLAGPSTGFDFDSSRPVEPVPGGGA